MKSNKNKRCAVCTKGIKCKFRKDYEFKKMNDCAEFKQL